MKSEQMKDNDKRRLTIKELKWMKRTKEKAEERNLFPVFTFNEKGEVVECRLYSGGGYLVGKEKMKGD